MKPTCLPLLLSAVALLLVFHPKAVLAQNGPGRRKMDEKYGFRDVRFETDSAAISGLQHAFDQAGLRYYERSSDNLHIGGAEVSNIYYAFAAGKLCQVALFVDGVANSNAIYEALKEEYGPIYQLVGQPDKGWTSNAEVISMERRVGGRTIIRFASRKMKDLERQAGKLAAKKAAGDL